MVKDEIPMQRIKSVLILALVLGAGIAVDFWIPPYPAMLLTHAAIAVIMAVSLNLVLGKTGQFSMGHAGFMAIGAYGSGALSLWMQQRGIGLPELVAPVVSLVFGGICASVFGYIVGLPSLRLKGDYLAIVTLGAGEIIRVIFLNWDSLGGARGMPGIPQTTSAASSFFWACFSFLFIQKLMNSAHGRAFLAVREDEIAASATGVHTTVYKVRAFVLSAFFAGVGGGLFAHQITFISPATFDFNKSFEFIIMVVLGGMGSLSGSVVAAIFVVIVKEALRPLQEITKVDLRMVIFSILLISMMLGRPSGLMGTLEFSDLFKRMKRRKRRAA